MCDLCDIFDDDDKYESKWKEVTCDTCGVPMMVYHDHVMKIPAEELKIGIEIALNNHPGCSIRTQARSIQDHYHFHIY